MASDADDARERVTLSRETIHNPADARHFMRAKPVAGRVRVLRGDTLLAETDAALRVVEVGRDVYDPVYYLPRDALRVPVAPFERRTHCPLKGDATYFTEPGAAEPTIWSYDRPMPFAAVLADRIAFYPAGLTFEETTPSP